ncbi:MAG: hypothetical protein KIT58_13765, partial [Planctomycetota bacterium]|nr:hypothetical protein [Planctomycetota bacterium]
MSQSSSGPPLTPSPEPEERSTTDGIIHHTTDMCQEAVQGALERSYADVDLEGYDQSLVDAAAAIDQALGRYDLATPGPERDKILAELSRRVEALADTPAPDPLEDGWPEDLDVHPRVDAERLLADTLEALDRADATALRTYWAGASDVARARLAAAVQRVAEGPIARRVAALGFPTDAARQRGIEVEDLPARIAAEMLAVTSMASVVSTERVE